MDEVEHDGEEAELVEVYRFKQYSFTDDKMMTSSRMATREAIQLFHLIMVDGSKAEVHPSALDSYGMTEKGFDPLCPKPSTGL